MDTAKVASASPYAGQWARLVNPLPAKVSVNLSKAIPFTGSAPVMHTRKELKSRPLVDGRRVAISRAKFGEAVMVDPYSLHAVSHLLGLAKKLSGVITTTFAPPVRDEDPTTAARNIPTRPMSCDNGNHVHDPSPDWSSSRSSIAKTFSRI